MDSGSYIAASGGLSTQRHLDVISNNLANVNTVGFKAERIVLKEQDFSDTLASKLYKNSAKAKIDQKNTPGVIDIKTETDFTQGPISYTSNPLNVALRKEKQFFEIQTKKGKAFSRAGNFTMDSNGNLVTPDGLLVMGQGGAISMPKGASKIMADGSVMVNNQVVGKIKVVEIEDLSKLKREEGVRFSLIQGANISEVEPSLVTSSLEMPNINAVTQMVQMINATRGFEAYTKTIKTIDELNQKAVNSIRIR